MAESDGAEQGSSERALAAAVLARLQPAPFWDYLGCRLLHATTGSATVLLPERAEHGRSSAAPPSSAHGGVLATLVDMAASCALLTLLAEDEGRTTIDLAVHYLAPARGDCTAVATVRRRGGRTAVIDVEITDAGAILAALGRATFAILNQR